MYVEGQNPIIRICRTTYVKVQNVKYIVSSRTQRLWKVHNKKCLKKTTKKYRKGDTQF